jgi:hypothetical protein
MEENTKEVEEILGDAEGFENPQSSKKTKKAKLPKGSAGEIGLMGWFKAHTKMAIAICAAVVIALGGILTGILLIGKGGGKDNGKTITLDFDSRGGQTVSAMQITVGTDVPLPTPLKPGSTFTGWTENDVDIVTTTANFKKDTTLFAFWGGNERQVPLYSNDVYMGNINIPASNGMGLSNADLNTENSGWILPTDEYPMDEEPNNYGIIEKNNYYDFDGWEYTDSHGVVIQLLFHRDTENNTNHTWGIKVGDAAEVPVSQNYLFNPPNYTTALHAILKYRPIEFVFHYKNSSDSILELTQDLLSGEEMVLPSRSEPTNFSHWEIISNAATVPSEQQDEYTYLQNRHYVPGEMITADPIMYYFVGQNDFAYDAEGTLYAVVRLMAETYEPNTQNVWRAFDGGGNGINGVRNGTPLQITSSELSLANPVRLSGSELQLFKDPAIDHYEFMQHEFKKLVIDVDSIADAYYPLSRGAYFGTNQAAIIDVYYKSYSPTVSISFDYGSGNTYIKDIFPTWPTAEPVTEMTAKGGDKITLPSAEMYIKHSYVFTGWRLEGGNETVIYHTNSHYTVPHGKETLQFVAVWRDPKFMFGWLLDGGKWLADPDLSSMRGTVGQEVKVTSSTPVKYGYNFVHWTLNGVTKGKGASITITNEVQYLTAVWTPKTITVKYAYNSFENGQVIVKYLNYTTTSKISVPDSPAPFALPSGSVLDSMLWDMSFREYYTFENKWEIPGRTDPVDAGSDVEITVDMVRDLLGENHISVPEPWVITIKAVQTGNMADIHYYNRTNHEITIGNNYQYSPQIPQGDKYSLYAPFNNNTLDLSDEFGWELTGWTLDTTTNTPISPNDIVPMAGDVNVYGIYRQKTFVFEFRNPNDQTVYEAFNRHYVDGDDTNNTITLPNDDYGFQQGNPDDAKGTFYAWEVGESGLIYSIEGNPKTLKLNNSEGQNETTGNSYEIAAKRMVGVSGVFTIVLYPRYSDTRITISYDKGDGNYANPSISDFTVKDLTVYAKTDANGYSYETALYKKVGQKLESLQTGGWTIGYDNYPSDYRERGIMLNDDRYFTSDTQNFIGWEAIDPLEKYSTAFRTAFPEGQLWFPGQFLPGIQFSVTFRAVWADRNPLLQQTIGNYKVLAYNTKFTNDAVTVADGDKLIVAFPKGLENPITKGSLKITGPGEIVRILLPNDNITVEAGAIIADGLKEIYIPDNLNGGNGSNYVSNILGVDETTVNKDFTGGSLERYIVQKGFDTWSVSIDPGNAGELVEFRFRHGTKIYKYGYADNTNAILNDCLVIISDGKNILLAVPSAIKLGGKEGEKLFTMPSTTNTSYRVASYAFANNKTINELSFAGSLPSLEIDKNAIYHTRISKIVLPKASTITSGIANVNPSCISGFQPKLASVTFGLENNQPMFQSNYAFVGLNGLNDQILYYDNDDNLEKENRTHIMYVLTTVEENSPLVTIEGSTETNKIKVLHIPATVRIINDYALSCLDYDIIKGIVIDYDEATPKQQQGITSNLTDAMFGIHGSVKPAGWDSYPIFVHKEQLDYYNGSKINTNPFYRHTQTYIKTVVFKKAADDATNVTATFEYGETIPFFDSEFSAFANRYNTIAFNMPWAKFTKWTVPDNSNYTGEYEDGYQYTILMKNDNTGGRSEGDIYINSEITFVGGWDTYSLQLVIRGDEGIGTEIDYNFEVADDGGTRHTIDSLAGEYISGSTIRLPGLPAETEYNFVDNGITYQFIGWVKADDWKGEWLWNNVDPADRILPDGNVEADFSSLDVQRFYALYDMVTDNLNYTQFSGMYSVTYKPGTDFTNVRIPYAHYDETVKYMKLVTRIGEDAMAGNDTFMYRAITDEIYIGGAILKISKDAFRGTTATSLVFGHVNNDGLVNTAAMGGGLIIGETAFADNKYISGTIQLPQVTFRIGDGAFRNNYALEGITLNFGADGNDKVLLAEVGEFAFAYNAAMTSNDVTIPDVLDNLTGFGFGVFMKSGLEKMVVHKGTLVYAGTAGKGVQPTIINNSDYIVVTIGNGDGITKIAKYAFAFNTYVNKIVIANSAMVVEDNAFFKIGEQLQIIDLKSIADPVTFDKQAFANVPPCQLYVIQGELSKWTGRFDDEYDNWFKVA